MTQSQNFTKSQAHDSMPIVTPKNGFQPAAFGGVLGETKQSYVQLVPKQANLAAENADVLLEEANPQLLKEVEDKRYQQRLVNETLDRYLTQRNEYTDLARIVNENEKYRAVYGEEYALY